MHRLSPADVAALSFAYQSLQRGDAAGAAAAAREVLTRAPQSADAEHLLALALRNSGDMDGAGAAFARALARAPASIDILNNFAGLLQRQGKWEAAIARYREALKLDPKRADIWINLARTQLDADDGAGALAAARSAIEITPDDARAHHMHGSALRKLGDFSAAEKAIERALELDPRNATVWTALGVLRRLIGDPERSLECYAKARALGLDTAELADAEASAHLDLGDNETALRLARALTQTAPAYVPGHDLVAHILWEHGGADKGVDPLGSMAQAVAAQPANTALRLALANALLTANRAAEALPHLVRLRTEKDSPETIAAHSLAVQLTGDTARAVSIYEDAIAANGGTLPRGLGTSFARILLRTARPDQAVRYALQDAEADFTDQSAWAVLATAWRMLDDPREHWLCDYERFIMTIEVEPPDAGERDAFIDTLKQTLTAMHVAKRAPMNQSLQGGSQTSGSLFGRPDPVIVGARDALHAAVRTLIARLPRDDAHPFLRRNTGDIRFTGSWSVRLHSAGNHLNHFHPKGWLSSAFYVELPPSVASNEVQHSGWIQFGQPPIFFETGLEPRRVVRPEPGRLVLFPSYMWHGTVPFADDAARMTIAFDAVPS